MTYLIKVMYLLITKMNIRFNVKQLFGNEFLMVSPANTTMDCYNHRPLENEGLHVGKGYVE